MDTKAEPCNLTVAAMALCNLCDCMHLYDKQPVISKSWLEPVQRAPFDMASIMHAHVYMFETVFSQGVGV